MDPSQVFRAFLVTAAYLRVVPVWRGPAWLWQHRSWLRLCPRARCGDAQTDCMSWDWFCRGMAGLHPGTLGLPWTWALEAVCALGCLSGLPASLETFPKRCGLCMGFASVSAPGLRGAAAVCPGRWRCASGLQSKAQRFCC